MNKTVEPRLYRTEDGGYTFSLAITAVLLISLIYTLIDPNSQNNYLAITASLVFQCCFVVIYRYYARYRGIRLLEASRFTKPTKQGVITTLALILAFFAVCIPLADGLIALFEAIGYKLTEVDYSPLQFVYFVAVSCLFAPIGEELIFRGAIMNSIKRPLRAVIVSALLFSLFHMSLEQTVYQMLLGALLGFIAIRFNCLPLAIMGHLISNVLAVSRAALYGYTGGGLIFDITMYAVAGAIAIMAALLFILRRQAFISIFKINQPKEDNEPDAKAVKLSRINAAISYAPGILIAGIIWIVTLIHGLTA